MVLDVCATGINLFHVLVGGCCAASCSKPHAGPGSLSVGSICSKFRLVRWLIKGHKLSHLLLYIC